MPGRPPAAIQARRLLGLAATAALLCVACGVSAPTLPPATPASTSAAMTPSPAPMASPSPAPSLSPAELATLIAEIEASVPPIRQLEPKTDVPNTILDEAGLRADLERVIAEGATPEEYAAQARLGEHLGFFPAGTDLQAVQLDLLGDQVLGYYDPDTKALAVVQRGGTFGPLQRVTLAHEYTHALQDQHFGLDALGTDDLSDGDRAVARIALQEGDATLLTQQWVVANLSFEEILEITKEALDPDQAAVLARVPPLISRQLEFPYADGLAFATALFERGGWAAVDAAFASPPDSTEQVIHPEKYLSHEAPLEVSAPLAATDLGKGWTAGWSDTIGELGIGVWLQPTAGLQAANEAAAGWAGDRVVLLEGPEGAWLVAWQTAWDTPADADAFAAAAEVRIETLSTPAVVSHTPGTTEVQVRIASVGELLRAVPAP